ncbi:MAG: hypothetical protein A2W91_06800 [Bacteroidetes bacterium GWF2_38_335]|nr:MAG: hypothetical protein A2W91_06800 [Bacteroidetes bacterium GWF2_38_335]OFY80913.1 MAG: hypothetical protein A2281_04905 [Bacteroidetes bacterium RIFOXYA12_FULL_38_20]HBS84925.1 hypothetical protein [Bacteroidales bacterium]
MKISTFILPLSAILLISAVLTVSSCRKPSPPTAVITVVNEEKVAVAGAEVTIYVGGINLALVDIANGKNKIVATTNSAGQVTLEFKYEAIYDVTAKQFDEDGNLMKQGDGVLILEEGKTYNEQIILRAE